MKRLKLFFACLLMAVLSIGQVWGESVTYTVSSATAVSTTGTAPDGSSATLSGTGTLNSGWIQCTAGNGKTLTLSGYEGNKITAITIYVKSNASKGGGSFSVVAGSTTLASIADSKFNTTNWNGGWNSTGVSKVLTMIEDDYEIQEDEGVVLTLSASANSLYIQSYTITYEEVGGDNASVSADPESVTNIAFAGVTDQTIDLTYENITGYETEVTVHPNADGTVTLSPAWLTASVSDADDYATVTYSVSANEGAARTAYIKVYTTDGDKEATTIIPVSQVSAPTGTFELFSGALEEGEYIICSGTNALKNTATSSPRIEAATVTISENKIENPDESLVWKIEALTGDDDGYWTFYNKAGDVYAAFTSTNARGNVIASVTNYAKWTTEDEGPSYDFTNKGLTSKYLRFNDGYGFASYATSTGEKLTLYKKSDGKPAAPLFTPAAGSYLEALNVTISAGEGTTIYYTTNATDPTTSSDVYSTPIPVSSTKTIKAIAVKDAVSSNVASATYIITEPLTVAEAIDAIPTAGNEEDDQYVVGYVCTAGTSVNASGQMTYYISADGTETNRLQIFKGKNLDNADFSDASDLAIGDKVIVHGQLYNFNGTPEMNTGNYIVSYTAKGALSSVVVSGTPTKTEYSADEAFEPAGLVVTATYASGYAVNVASELAAADWSADPATVTAEGDINVTATYGGKTSVAYPVHVTVLAATLDHISLSYDAVEVYQGKPLPKPVVTAHWSDATTSDVTALAEFTGFDAATPGDQEITVSYTFGGDTKEETYTVTVNPIYNVELTVSVAKDLIETVVGNTESTSDMIVRGIVSQVGSISSKCLTYYISDDGTTTNQLEIYKGKYLSNADFTEGNKLKVGDEVVVTGKVIYYNNNTAEFANGKSEVTSLARVPNFEIAAVASFEVGAADLAVADLTVTKDGEGAVTLTSSNHTEYVSIVDGKLRAVAAGDATITANLAANGIYKAAEATFNVTVIPAQTKYTITFDANGATGGSAPTAIADKAAGAEVTLPENSYAWPHYTFTGWKVYDANEDEVTVNEGVFVMPASNVTIKAQWAALPVWAYTYTSNVTLTGAKVKFYGEETEYDAVKTGSSGSAGSTTITVPAQATKLHFHAYGWNSENVGLTVTAPAGVTVSPATEISINKNTGIANNSPFTLAEGSDPEHDAYYVVELEGNTTETTLTFSATSGKRFVLFGVNQEGGVLPVLQSLTLSGDLENKTYEANAAINPAGLTVMGTYTLGGVAQTPVNVTSLVEEWLYDALQVGDESVTISAKIGTVTSNGLEITGLTVSDPTPRFETNPASSINFGSKEQGETIADRDLEVTLVNVSNASVEITGTGAAAFSVDEDALTGSATLHVSASSANVGTFAATLTISDEAGVAADKEISLSLTVTAPVVAETPVSTTSEWVAATAADLVDGAEVLITGVKDDVTYAVGDQNDNNRAAVAGTLSEGVFTPGENTMSFTLVAQEEEGVFALQASNGEYLYAASSAKNYLKRQATLDDNAKWTLTATSAVANGSNTHNDLKFNATNSPKIFSCYSSGQTAIQFYVRKPATPPTPVSEDVRFGLEPNRYYTICLPKNVTAATGATFWNLQYRNEGNTEVYLEGVDQLDAGKPYIFQATAATLNVTYGDETVAAPVENGALRGTFVDIDADAFALLSGDVYLLINNAIRPRTTGNFLNANRAYILYNELDPLPAAGFAPGKRVRAIPMQGQTATGMDNVQGDDVQCTKVLIDGQMYILRANRMYDVTGKLVK